MTAETLWQAFCREQNITDAEYDAWAFGVDADFLADLVVRGEKTATASAYPLYEADGEPLPQVGQYSVILDGNDNARCIIQTTQVYTVPFCQVSAEHAYKEGEGDKSLAYWRRVHQQVFSQWLSESGLEFTTETPVVCEEFQVVYQ